MERFKFDYPSNFHNGKKCSVSNLLHLCLNNISAPALKHVCISKNSKLCWFWQATKKLRYKQDHNWAGPVTHSNKNIHNKTSAEERSRTSKDSKRLKKNGNGTNLLSQVISELIHRYLPKRRMQYWNQKEVMFHWFDKFHHSFLEITMAENYLHIWRVDQKIPHKKIGETSCRQKTISFELPPPIFVPAVMTTNTRGTLKEKPQNQSIRDRTNFGMQFCKSFSKISKRVNFEAQTDLLMRRNHFELLSNYVYQRNEINWCIQFASFMFEQCLNSSPRLACISKKIKFFLVFPVQKKISARTEPTLSSFIDRLQ